MKALLLIVSLFLLLAPVCSAEPPAHVQHIVIDTWDALPPCDACDIFVRLPDVRVDVYSHRFPFVHLAGGWTDSGGRLVLDFAVAYDEPIIITYRGPGSRVPQCQRFRIASPGHSFNLRGWAIWCEDQIVLEPGQTSVPTVPTWLNYIWSDWVHTLPK